VLDLRKLRYFVTVAETRHFGRAAARLNLSQPPLSRQIAQLEKDLGVQLLERHSRHAALTRAGERFLVDAKAILASVEQAERNVRLAEQGELGELAIGFMMHAAYTIVPRLTRRFASAYPHVRITLRETLPNLLEDDISNGRYDVGIMFPLPASSRLSMRSIFREPLCAAMHPSHPLAERSCLTAEDFRDVPLLATPVDVAPTLRAAIAAYCGSAGFAPAIRFEVQLQQTIVSMVAENLGLAILPQSMRRLGLADVTFRDLDHAPIVEHVVAWRPDFSNPAVKAFLAIVDA
jgi:DNA-binding transcriptional LysR family regulator